MSASLRAGVVGVGSMGRNHARVYASMEGVELAAVADADVQAASRVGNMYRCTAYNDVGSMLANEQLDLVSIVVPTRHHFAVAAGARSSRHCAA